MMIRGLNICFRLSIRPEVEKTILFGATSVAARPELLGHLII